METKSMEGRTPADPGLLAGLGSMVVFGGDGSLDLPGRSSC